VLEAVALDVAVADGVGCEDFGAGPDAGPGRSGVREGAFVLSLSRSQVSEAALAAVGFGGCGGSLASRSSSGSMRSSVRSPPGAARGPGFDADAGDAAAGGAPALSPADGSLNAKASRGVSTGRSGSGSGSGRDLGSIMCGSDLRQSRRRSCNGRASKPTCRLTDRRVPVLES
jgi:hypothetical protein